MAKVFKKLYISDAAPRPYDSTKLFRKLSTFVINGTYRFNDTITELPIVYADGEDLESKTKILITCRDTHSLFPISGFSSYITTKYFKNNSWAKETDRYFTFYNSTAKNAIGEDVTKILDKWLTDNATKPGQIAFTIDGTTYQADDGMSWVQWCGSDYNTDGYNFLSNVYKGIATENPDYVATAVSDGTKDYRVERSDIITAGYNYVLVQG